MTVGAVMFAHINCESLLQLVFPEGEDTLNMELFLPQNAPPAEYKFQGAVFHKGDSPHSGHYFGFVESNCAMYKVNDHIVTPLIDMKETTVVGQHSDDASA